jgi:hypothetical protein
MTKSDRAGLKSASPRTTPRPGRYTPTGLRDEHTTDQTNQMDSQPISFEGVVPDDAEKDVISPLGFLGESSTNAVVAELIDSMGVAEMIDSMGETRTEVCQAQTGDDITEAMVQRGAAILFHLQAMQKSLDEYHAWMRNGDGYLVFRKAYQLFLSELWQYSRTSLKDIPQGQRLQHLSKRVWQNTYKAMKVSSESTIEDWALQATGENLRWETVGLLFSAVGLRASGAVFAETQSLHDAARPMGRVDWAKVMLKLVDECIEFCRKCGSCSDLYACLLYERSPLVEWVRGDVSAEAWTRFSDVCNVAVELGLHREKRVDARTPFFLCELRIRLFGAIYVHDKYVSTYLGRPPHISYRHCVIQLPTDLCDDDICSNQTDLLNTLANLNGGYARSGQLGRATLRRATTGHFIIREEILEILLGNPQDDVSDRIHQIRDKIVRSTEEMPSFIRLDPEELLDKVWSGRPVEIPGRKVTWQPLDVILVVTFHCNLRYTNFLLERAFVRRSKVDPSKLIVAARSLLDLTMKTTSGSGFLHGFHLYRVELVSRRGECSIY